MLSSSEGTAASCSLPRASALPAGEHVDRLTLATQQQKSAADQVATAIVQIRASADQSAAEQTQRAVTCRRVDELVADLERSLHAGSQDALSPGDASPEPAMR